MFELQKQFKKDLESISDYVYTFLIIMAKHKPNGPIIFEPAPSGIGGFVDALNSKYFYVPVRNGARWEEKPEDHRPIQTELRRFVGIWKESGFNVSKLFEAEPELARRAHNSRASLGVTDTGRLWAIIDTSPKHPFAADPPAVAIGLFLDFLLNPFNLRLRGPCAYCDKFFVKETGRKKSVYCSQLCARRFTSRLANQRRRKTEHLEQLALAKISIQKWSKAKTKSSWKEWVSKHEHISKHWLTKALHKGELVERTKLKRERV